MEKNNQNHPQISHDITVGDSNVSRGGNNPFHNEFQVSLSILVFTQAHWQADSLSECTGNY